VSVSRQRGPHQEHAADVHISDPTQPVDECSCLGLESTGHGLGGPKRPCSHHLGTPAPKITDRKKEETPHNESPGGDRPAPTREDERETEKSQERAKDENKPQATGGGGGGGVEKSVEGKEDLFFWDFRRRSPRS
jgi:hypothetical protein